jgi:hypothetical protein
MVYRFISPQTRGFKPVARYALKPREVLLCVLPCGFNRPETFRSLGHVFCHALNNIEIQTMHGEFSIEHINLSNILFPDTMRDNRHGLTPGSTLAQFALHALDFVTRAKDLIVWIKGF